MPTRVLAHCHEGKWHEIEVEDDVTAYLEFENGATGVFVTTTGDAPGTNRLEITLEKAKLVCENNNLTIFELEISEREHCFSTKEGFVPPKGKFVEVTTDGKNSQHVGVLIAFADHILHGTPLIAKGVEGIHGLELSNAMHLSSWLNQMVNLPIDEEQFLHELNKKRTASSEKRLVKETVFDTSGSYGS